MYKLKSGLSLILLFALNLAIAQERIAEKTFSGSFEQAPLSSFIKYLEDQYQLNIFYESDWIDTITVTQTFVDLPLVQVLNHVFEDTALGYQFFQNDGIILLPRSVIKQYVIDNDDVNMLVIGNEGNEGRYRRATIRGTIVNGKNREQLTGAVIYNKGLDEGITTDQYGEFKWNLATGEHELQISFVGFEPLHQKIKLIEDGTVTFDLFEETHNLEVITVLGNDQYGSRSQMSMVKVKAKTIKELPVLMGEADVIKSVVMMPGIQSVGELSAGFNVRGGNTDQNLVLLDGASIFNTSHLFGFFSMINPDAVEDIVVYKGGMPASFGERVSSVMDVQLKDGNTENLKLYGGLGLINSRFTFEGPFIKNKKSSFMLGARSTYSDWILRELKDDELRESTARFFDVNGNINLHLGDKNDLKLSAYISGDNFNLNKNSLYHYTNSLASLKWKDSFGAKVNSDFSMTFSKYDFSLTETNDFGDELDYKLLTSIENLGLKYIFSYLPNELIKFETGFQGAAYRINPGEIVPTVAISRIIPEKVDDEQAVEFAGFISSDFDLSESVAMSLGMRYSYFMNLGESTVYLYDENRPKTAESNIGVLVFGENELVKRYQGFEPRISFKYKLHSGGSLRWSYQRVFQYLSQISNTSVVSPADFWKTSDYYTKPLIADQLALGYFKKIKEYGIDASAEVYYKQLQNLLEYKNGAELLMNHSLETDLIQAKGYSYGVELLLKKSDGRLNGWLSYAYSRTMRKTDPLFDEETVNQGKYYPSVYDKPHDFSLAVNYQISRRWRFSGNFVFASGRPTTLPELRYDYGGQQIVYYSDRNEYRMPTYHRLDVSITFDENLRKKRMWKGSWTLSIYNLYGRNNPYSVYYLRQSKQNLSSDLFGLYKFSIIGVPVPSLTYNFKF